ncbi:SulP family inorganic anion transporter [Jiangella anatolica]|uniref:SulP family inorganic anion transporter n=1 Tax=Jiangella anatolica TaxID=2670374 RepID=A0A2W2B1I2_9ACTN|nr:SulP family inorganic anion transporter [Jiangella anatolica]PZF81291.1 SulP family inorganic anion transporter [Jiangella anatolica]
MPAWVFGSLRGASLRRDLMAGLTVWAVLIPESLAYASIAGVPPVIGLYAAIPALLLYPVLGSSRHLVVGPMSATAALSAGVVGGIVSNGSGEFPAYTAGLALAVGALAVLAGLLRLGFLANFVSEPVLKGFIVGMALVIIVGQLPKLFGIEGGDGDFFQKLWAVVTSLGDTNGWSALTGLGCLALVLVLRRVAPLVPGSLAAVVLGIVLATLLDLEDRGVDVVGHIDAGLAAPAVPDLNAASDIPLLLSGAAGVMLIGFAEGLGAAKNYARRDGYRIDANRELAGLGAANLGSGFLQGMVVNGSLSKTAVNAGAGARSQVSGWTVAALTVLTLLILTPLFAQLPEPALAAVVIAAVIELVDVGGLRRLYEVNTAALASIYGRAARADFICALGALLGVLVFGTLPGLLIGVVLSVVLLLARSARPHIAVLGRVAGQDQWVDRAREPGSTPVDGVVVVRVESGLYFANSDTVQDRLLELAGADGVRALVLDAATVPFVDVTAAGMLRDTAAELRGDGVRLLVVGDVGQVRDVLRRAGAAAVVDRLYPSIDAAVAATSPGEGEAAGDGAAGR